LHYNGASRLRWKGWASSPTSSARKDSR
jgi:hypothetical protein